MLSLYILLALLTGIFSDNLPIDLEFTKYVNLNRDAEETYTNNTPTVIAGTNRGKVRGYVFKTENGNEGLVFQGVPFAEPPIGKRRFLQAEDKKPWSGVIDALEYGAACMQDREVLKMPGKFSEDCLYLNIFAPRDALDGAKRYPVVYYVFGGAWDYNSPRIFHPKYLIDSFMSRGIVFVTTNYRLSGLGFWTTGTNEAPGNAAVLDIIQGLRWTNEEIHNFGGDPHQITFMGHSSGAMGVSALTLSPMTEGLYQQALPMSGSGIPSSVDNDLTRHKATAEALGCNKGNRWEKGQYQEILDCLQHIDALNFTLEFYKHKNKGKLTSEPRIDGPGRIFPKPLLELAKTRRAHPYLLGTTSNEVPYSRSAPQPTREEIASKCTQAANLGNYTETVVEACIYHYDVEVRQAWKPEFLHQPIKAISSDYQFYAPVFLDAQFMRQAGGPVYLYSFEYMDPILKDIAVAHAMDLYYIFGYPPLPWPVTDADLEIGRNYGEAFANFFKYGNPHPTTPAAKNVEKWEALRSPIGFNYYRFDRNCTNKEFYHFDAAEFWNDIVPYLDHA